MAVLHGPGRWPSCLERDCRAGSLPDAIAGGRAPRLCGTGVSVTGVNGGVLARRVGIVVLCVLSLGVCVLLAWWQWNRFENGGTWQNLGYVLQWPLFGLFPAFMFWRLRKLRAESREREQGPGQTREQTPDPAEERAESHPTPPAETDIPVAGQTVRREDSHDDDPELAAYNRMLAQLNARDQQETR